MTMTQATTVSKVCFKYFYIIIIDIIVISLILIITLQAPQPQIPWIVHQLKVKQVNWDGLKVKLSF